MSRLVAALCLILVAFVGFLRLLWKLSKAKEEILFAQEFLGQLQKLAQRLPDRLDQDSYLWLTQHSVRMQREMGQLGTVAYRPAFENAYIDGYQIILNTLGKLRTSGISEMDLTMCEDAVLRYMGVLNDDFTTLRSSALNPLIWLPEGVRFFLAIPLYIFQSFGLLAAGTARFFITSHFFKAVSGLIALIGLVSSLVTIVVGWKPFLEITKRVLPNSNIHPKGPNSDMKKAIALPAESTTSIPLINYPSAERPRPTQSVRPEDRMIPLQGSVRGKRNLPQQTFPSLPHSSGKATIKSRGGVEGSAPAGTEARRSSQTAPPPS